MNFSLNDNQRSLRDRIRRFARSELHDGARVRDRDEKFARDLWIKCGDMALQGMPAPVEYGGMGLDALSTAVGLEALGYGCDDGGLVFAICAHTLACVVPLCLHGSEAQKRAILPHLSNGRLIGVNAMTEPGGGSDPFAMTTRAVAADDGFVITGKKTFISNSAVADVAIVYAATDPARGFAGGVTAFLVDMDVPGVRRGRTFESMGLRTCPVGEIEFGDVRVGNHAVLGTVGSGGAIFAEAMDWERSCVAAAHVGAMERLLERAISFAKTRMSSGKPIAKLQAISHKIADMKVRLDAARLLTYYAAAQLSERRRSGVSASVTKVFVSEALVQSALDTVQVLGGYGFIAENDVERALRDAVGGTLYSGTSEVQRNIIARWLGL